MQVMPQSARNKQDITSGTAVQLLKKEGRLYFEGLNVRIINPLRLPHAQSGSTLKNSRLCPHIVCL